MRKLKQYNSDLDRVEVTTENCQELTGCTVQELVAFTGIYAVIRYDEIKTLTIRGRYPSPNIVVLAENLEVSITIHIEDNYIFDELVICQVRKENVGLKMLSMQLNEACNVDFNFIKLEAARELYNGIQLIGYLIWCKYGFIMDEDSIPLFQSIIKPYNDHLPLGSNPIVNLLELVSTEEGKNFWEINGDSWMGTFFLEKMSQSWEILNAYKKRKGL